MKTQVFPLNVHHGSIWARAWEFGPGNRPKIDQVTAGAHDSSTPTGMAIRNLAIRNVVSQLN